MTLYILSYNNYYNRILKYENNLEDYYDYINYTLMEANFNNNDGVNTSHIIGSGDWDGVGDYLIAVEGNNIKSRWFIIEAERTRAGQYKISLRRDLLVDYWADVKDAPCFIEKAILTENNPLIYNSENMTFNQIKKSEMLLKDLSKCPWIVGYYAKNTAHNMLAGTVDLNFESDIDYIPIDTTFENWKFNATETPFKVAPQDIEYRIYGMKATTSIGFQSQNGYIRFDKEGNYLRPYQYVANLSTPLDFHFIGDIIGNALQPEVKARATTMYNYLQDYADITSDEDTAFFTSLKNKVIKDTTGKYYSVNIIPGNVETTVVNISSGNLFQTMKTICNTSSNLTGTPDNTSFKAAVSAQTYTMEYSVLTTQVSSWDMSGDKITTEDAPYNIFAIPYGSVKLFYTGGGLIGESRANIGIATANSIIRTMGSNLYDIQLLPYCPLALEDTRRINLDNQRAYSLIRGPQDSVVGFILNIPYSKFSFDIELANPITVSNKKMSNECDVYKLCSPNWASEFQFSPAKNDGVRFINVDCEYKPFQPYIHLNPNFRGMYGRDFNDARGLICSGDFSLAQVSDAWQNYQINNKNFQSMFDRQIQNMEVKNKISRTQDIISSTVGAVSGAAAGAMTGNLMAPGVGAIPGAVIGGVASAAGGIADYAINEKLRNEAMDYTKDMFGYQLGNIQALPYTLTKVSSFNYNNKIFPLIEYYTCTDEEKTAFANKIAYNGMTVGVIGKISDYLGNTWSYNDIEAQGYIKGQLIRLDLGEDFHIVNAISGELNKGVYTL